MVEIIQNSKYNARAMQKADIKNKIPGYNFAYPVLNTIEITNLFINGGPIDITIERSGLSTWSFDTQTETLIVAQDNKQERHVIKNIEDLVETMNKYFDENKDVLMKDNLATNMKKSNSKIGNQNARRQSQVYNNCTNNSDTTPEIKNTSEIEKDEFCQLDVYLQKTNKTLNDYFKWIVDNSFIWRTNQATRNALIDAGCDIDRATWEERNAAFGGWSPYTYEQKKGLD